MSSDSPKGRVVRTDRGRPDAGARDIHFANGLGGPARVDRRPSERHRATGVGSDRDDAAPRPSRPDQFRELKARFV